ncbi:MAG: HNH endonuclease [Candidatus Acidiferrales bacterium]
MLDPQAAFETEAWKCAACTYVHCRNSDLPFENWPPKYRKHISLPAERFWIGFFRIATEHPSSYWKQCNVCGRVLPFEAFSRHAAWGVLERQMECRGCKGAINAVLNPRRTRQQLHESAVRRRVADLLLEGENRPVDISRLFQRFGSKCFKCGKRLSFSAHNKWDLDHILPSKYLYPLTVENAALLCAGCNNTKHGRWPSDFYTNNQLISLSKLTGADLSLLASANPLVNPDIDVDECVSRYLKVRERSNLAKRVKELKRLLVDNKLVPQLSTQNRKALGLN